MASESRLINVKPLMEDGWHLVKTGESNRFLTSMSLADVPTVDAVEVVHGRWIWKNDRCGCSECRKCLSYDGNGVVLDLSHLPYCPHCGAKMDGGNEDE